jgi:hypothetical protein
VGVILYGMFILEMDDAFSRPGLTIAILLNPFVYGAIGGFCLAIAKRMQVWLSLANQSEDVRAPVVYLRSFRMDRGFSRRPLRVGRLFSIQTEEEQLAQALREIGPVVAMGKPGERLPRLGAHRIYVEDADWQEQVLAWFARAALVVIHVPPKPTESLTWEVDQSLSVVAPDRLIFLLSRDVRCLEWLNRKIQDHGLTGLRLEKLPRAPYRSRVSGIVYFVGDKQSEFSPLVKPPLFRRPLSSPLVRVYRLALKPVITHITGSWTPLPRAFGEAFIATLLTGFFAVAITFAIYLQQTDPLRRERAVWGHHLLKQLPTEALDLAKGGDKAALSAWMQSHYQSGIQYIANEDVIAQVDIVYRLLTLAHPADCAILASAILTHQDLHGPLYKLVETDRAAFNSSVAFIVRAITESLRSKHDQVFPVSEEDATAAMHELYKALLEEDRDQFDQITDNDEVLNAEEHCWYVRTIYGVIRRLNEPFRSRLARVFLGQHPED